MILKKKIRVIFLIALLFGINSPFIGFSSMHIDPNDRLEIQVNTAADDKSEERQKYESSLKSSRNNGEVVVEFERLFGKDTELSTKATGVLTPSISVTNINPTSMTINVTYPQDGAWGNQLQIYHWLDDNWNDVTSLGYYVKNGSYTINNLVPGEQYSIYFKYYDHQNYCWPPDTDNTITYVRASWPPEELTSYSMTNMTFQLDKCLIDQFNLSSGKLTRFLTKVDDAYAQFYDLVGGDKPFDGATMQLKSARYLPPGREGLSGQPIQWNTFSDDYTYGSIAHVLQMNKLNVDLTEIPLHEIAHNFDSWKWSFESEAIGYLMVYYYFGSTNESMAVAGCNIAFNGNSYKTYMKSHADRFNGCVNYDVSIPYGVYSPYGLAYNLSVIADAIGWQPFKDTFRYFEALDYSLIPNTCIGKFNLFLSKLKDYSGKDVFAMFTTQEKLVYQRKLGGTIAYVNDPFINQEVFE